VLLDNFHFIARTAGFRSHSQKLESLYSASIISNIPQEGRKPSLLSIAHKSECCPHTQKLASLAYQNSVSQESADQELSKEQPESRISSAEFLQTL